MQFVLPGINVISLRYPISVAVVIMFKKSSKRNLRQRKDDSDEENNAAGGDTNANGINIASIKAGRKKKEKSKTLAPKPDKSSLLSFGQDEEEAEEEVFQLKKSSRSKRIAKHIKKLAQEEKEQKTSTGEYTKERLAELKRSSTAPQSLNNSPSLTRDLEYPGEERETASGFGSVNGGLSFRPGEIPDANRIHAARKQREMMRKYGADYIPVENTDTVKKNTNSRLVRDDDAGSSSGDENGPTVELRGIIDDGVRVAKEIGDQGEGPLLRDEEFDEWEAEMIKKGTSTQQLPKWETDQENSMYDRPYQSDVRYSQNAYGGTALSAPKTATPKTAMTPTETVAAVKEKISKRLEGLKQVHRTHKLDIERAELDIKESEDSATNLQDTTTLSKQYTYFQDLKAYITDLIDCLSEKSIEIDAMEKRRHRIWKDRADLFISRRQQDVEDESSDITTSLANVKANPVQNDIKKQTRVREREARRSRRRSARERTGANRSHIDGTSTDEEETSMDMAKFSSELEKIQSTKGTIFEDVVEEFYDVDIIMSRFEQWRAKYPDSYNDAYIGLCLPRLLTPFVRISMLHWNPLEADCKNFEDMKWYEDLLFYGLTEKSTELEPVKGNPDNKVLSSLFERVILPKLSALVRDVWDPLSGKQSRRLSLLLCRLARSYPCMRPENRRCGELLTALCTRMQRTLDNDIFIPLYQTNVLTNTVSGPGAFFERQTWTCIKLYENIIIFNGVLARNALYELVFTSLLNRYIMLSLQTSPITAMSVQKCQRIADAIPAEWLDKDAEELSTHLASFSRYLLHSAKHIHTQLSVMTDIDKRRARSCITKLGKLLSYIGSDDSANQVLELLGIKTLT